MSKVSIIIPCYNQANFLHESLNSALQQSTGGAFEIEVIVINDGSTDHTSAVVADFAHRNLVYLEQENKGLGAARNVGIERSTGTYLQFLDADDLLHPEKLVRQIGVLEEDSGLDLIMCNFEEVDERGCKIRDSLVGQSLATDPMDLFPCLLASGFFPPHVPLVRRSAVEQAGCFSEERGYAGVADYLLWSKIASRNGRYVYLAQVLALYRKHGGSMSTDHAAMRKGFEHVTRELIRMDSERVVQGLEVIRDSFRGRIAACDNLDRMVKRVNETSDSDQIGSFFATLLRERASQLVIWGAGTAGKRACKLLDELGLQPECFLDSDKSKEGTQLLGLPIHVGHDWLRKPHNGNPPMVLIASQYYEEIIESLKTQHEDEINTLIVPQTFVI